MQTGYQLRLADARAMLELAAAIADCAEPTELAARIEAVPELIGAESVIVLSSREWMAEVSVEFGDPDVYRPVLLDAVNHSWRDHPVMGPDLTAAAQGSRRLSDLVGVRDWHRRGLFNDFYRPLGMTRELSVQLAWGPVGSSCCVALHRSGRDFGERERTLLGLIAPHLRSTRSRIAQLARSTIPSARRDDTRARVENLLSSAATSCLVQRLPITAREADVLVRLAAGRTNGGIALDLGISPYTVLRHVEHLYAKLDVHTRATATRVALETLLAES